MAGDQSRNFKRNFKNNGLRTFLGNIIFGSIALSRRNINTSATHLNITIIVVKTTDFTGFNEIILRSRLGHILIAEVHENIELIPTTRREQQQADRTYFAELGCQLTLGGDCSERLDSAKVVWPTVGFFLAWCGNKVGMALDMVEPMVVAAYIQAFARGRRELLVRSNLRISRRLHRDHGRILPRGSDGSIP